MVIGGLQAIGQKDLKRKLAYSSISQMGYVLIAIGLALKPGTELIVASLALIGGLFHLVNHAVFKSLLFLASGAIEYRTGTRDLGKLGGLIKKMPVTGTATAIGSLSISGIPPFNGFWSKLIIILALFRGGFWIYGTVGVIVGFITLIYFVMLQKESIFGKIPESLSKVKEAPFAMVLPLVILAALCVAMGIGYMFVEGHLLDSAANALLDKMAYMNYLIGG